MSRVLHTLIDSQPLAQAGVSRSVSTRLVNMGEVTVDVSAKTGDASAQLNVWLDGSNDERTWAPIPVTSRLVSASTSAADQTATKDARNIAAAVTGSAPIRVRALYGHLSFDWVRAAWGVVTPSGTPGQFTARVAFAGK